MSITVTYVVVLQRQLSSSTLIMFDQHQTFYVILDRAFNQFLIIILMCVWGGVGVCVGGVCG